MALDYAQALDVALCYGWIDGQKGKFDDQHWLQRFTPRKPNSKWSKVNRDKVTALIEQGRMQPAGLAEVERAKTDGRWEAAYDGARTSSVPDDLVAALTTNPAAAEFFETLDRRNRFAILYRIQDAKKPETRARRIEQYVAMLAEGKKLHP
ncbi:YdeI/OmpD-associated family protein [Pedococcus cremeus]|uniref:YdeI/OmpD-associated family protein n=1 Tax=Pedococcus cremeus TaxID=587636 RepID=UPI001FDFBF63|nr:YdeI/OmpD-associated family protein [Pedococcus cremeus]